MPDGGKKILSGEVRRGTRINEFEKKYKYFKKEWFHIMFKLYLYAFRFCTIRDLFFQYR